MSRLAKKQASFLQLGALAAAALLAVSGITSSQAAAAIGPIDLGSAANFAVLAGSGITNTGTTRLSGTAGSDIGSSPNFAFTGYETVETNGTKYLLADDITATAKLHLQAAYDDAVSRTPTSLNNFSLTGTLLPGVYNSATSLGIASTLTLDAQGDADAIFIFQAHTTLITAANSEVRLINGARAGNVYWQVGSSATFGANSSFAGRVMAFTTTTVDTGASFQGQLLSINGAVTLIANNFVNDSAGNAPKVLFVSSSTTNGSLLRGDQISVQVHFSQVVTVTGTPTITLETGAIDRVVSYTSGSQTNTLVFVYTVQPGDTSADLDYLASNSLALNGGTILNAAGNAAVLTLSEPGTPGSLAANKALLVDGDSLRLELSASSETSTSAAVSWTLDASAAVNCATLSKVDGVDFDFVGLSSIESITPSADNTACVISATSAVLAAQFGTSSLEIASGFSVNDPLGDPHELAARVDTEIFVDIEPDSSGLGGVTTDTSAGVVADEYSLELDRALFPGGSDDNLESLLQIGMVNTVDAAPGNTILIDQSELSDPTTDLMSMSFHYISAGETISLKLEVSSEISGSHSLAAYVKNAADWTYAGETELRDTVAETNGFTLTEPGTYVFRLHLIPDEIDVFNQSLRFGLAEVDARPSNEMSTMGTPEASLPDVNQSHEAHIIVTDSVTTSAPTTPAPGPVDDNGTPAPDEPVVEEPAPDEPVVEEPGVEEPGVDEPVVDEPVVDETLPSEEAADAVTETDTGGQLPDTGNSSWLIPLGIGAGIAALGAVVFFSRRRSV